MDNETINILENLQNKMNLKEKEINEKIKKYCETLHTNIFNLDPVFLDINVNANLIIKLGFGYFSSYEGYTIFAKVIYLGYLGGPHDEYSKTLLECPLSIKVECVPFLDKLVSQVILECNKILNKPIN